MREIVFTAALLLAAAPAFAQQAPGPDSAYQRHAAREHFANAGASAGQTARETGRALHHGWEATKQAVGSGWNRITNDNNDNDAND
jgi:hypothetical protein